MKKPKGMVSQGRDIIFLRGSRETVWRTVYWDGERFWCVWYGELIELRRSKLGMGFATVDKY